MAMLGIDKVDSKDYDREIQRREIAAKKKREAEEEAERFSSRQREEKQREQDRRGRIGTMGSSGRRSR